MKSSEFLSEFSKQVEAPLEILLTLLDKGHHQAAVDVVPNLRQAINVFKSSLEKEDDQAQQSSNHPQAPSAEKPASGGAPAAS